MKKIGICSDHAGFEYKSRLIVYLKRKGFEVVDYGTSSEESCDYPDYAHVLGYAVDKGEVEGGIAICGTGNGMALCLNRHPSVRAGLAWTPEVARLVKCHNNANVLVLPARFASYRTAVKMVRVWMETEFEAGRHQQRIDKIVIH